MGDRDQESGIRDRGPGTKSTPHKISTTDGIASASLPIPGPGSPVPGVLYIVATPIGNLEDITLRALRILKEVDLIAAEDTRHSRKLLSHYGISRPLTSYFDHNKNIKGNVILDRLKGGESVALISDAGTPCISDPGYQLVRDAVAAAIPVVPIPGPSAAIAALSAAGLPSDAFTFVGFLPNRAGKRREKLAALAAEERVVLLYESPRRLLATLADVRDVCGDREVVVVRELTKVYEEFIRGDISTVAERLHGREIRGEVVLLIAPAVSEARGEAADVAGLLRRYMVDGELTLKDAVARVARETGSPRGAVYEEALRQKETVR